MDIWKFSVGGEEVDPVELEIGIADDPSRALKHHVPSDPGEITR
jgi:hypothetical protein